jgi:type IV pilus assembly protein PilM
MEFLPRTLGTRPRLACEIRAEGVVAARSEDASAMLSAVSRVALADGAMVSGLRAGATLVRSAAASAEGVSGGGSITAHRADGGVAERIELVSAVRKALETVALRAREVTLVVPDAAVRVLLLDFDALPSRMEEALPVVRFRLKKLLPFDADGAAVSYQVMSSAKGMVTVVAVAMPRDVLEEYEAVVRAAGFEPGAVLPSTLAALAGLPEEESPVLVVNAGLQGVTTAIVRGGVLLLHRTVDLGLEGQTHAALPQEVQAVSVTDLPATVIAMERMATGETQIALLAPATPAPPSMVMAAGEVAQAVSVAAAYFEDTLQTPPKTLLTTGTMGADGLAMVLQASGVGPVRVEEIVSPEMLGPGVTTAGAFGTVPVGWLAGVRGALSD